jgi:hypothetical protein
MTNVFNPLFLMLNIGGVLVRGFAKGDFISITPKGADNTSKQGPDGSVSVSVLPNDLHDVKIVLMHGTPAHKSLSALRKTLRALPSPITTITFTDTLMPESWSGTAWFTTPAGSAKGDEGKDHEWNMEALISSQT